MTKQLTSRIRKHSNDEKAHDRRSTDTLAAGDYAPIDVADPFDPESKITVLRQLRSDPLARLHAHRQIDDAQYHAGRAYQRDWEVAERGARAIDPTREAVDGGKLAEPLTDRQARARARLIDIESVIGRKIKTVVDAVLIEGMTVEALTISKFQRSGQTWTRYFGTMFRDGLDMLAVEYKLASR